MTTDYVKASLANIAKLAAAGDYERAHTAQDLLYLQVLEAIAVGAENAREIATEALKANEIRFARYCA